MTVDDSHAALQAIGETLRDCKSVLAITGAGISADSGLPTYRGIGGLYENNHTDEGVPIEQALSGPMLARRPELTWRYIHQIERACRGVLPNRAHGVLREMELTLPRFCVLTQNVDGLHRAAGTENLIEMHGSVDRVYCSVCGWEERRQSYEGMPDLPRCPDCGSVIRPNVVLFGEMLPAAAVQQLQRELSQGFDVVLSIGTTSAFPYIAEPVYLAKSQGKMTVEINPGESAVSHVVTHRLRLGAAEALDRIWTTDEQSCAVKTNA